MREGADEHDAGELERENEELRTVEHALRQREQPSWDGNRS
ncbi:hypothetical protein WME79_13245 [Sorangium sp. So ce726]